MKFHIKKILLFLLFSIPNTILLQSSLRKENLNYKIIKYKKQQDEDALFIQNIDINDKSPNTLLAIEKKAQNLHFNMASELVGGIKTPIITTQDRINLLELDIKILQMVNDEDIQENIDPRKNGLIKRLQSKNAITRLYAEKEIIIDYLLFGKQELFNLMGEEDSSILNDENSEKTLLIKLKKASSELYLILLERDSRLIESANQIYQSFKIVFKNFNRLKPFLKENEKSQFNIIRNELYKSMITFKSSTKASLNESLLDRKNQLISILNKENHIDEIFSIMNNIEKNLDRYYEIRPEISIFNSDNNQRKLSTTLSLFYLAIKICDFPILIPSNENSLTLMYMELENFMRKIEISSWTLPKYIKLIYSMNFIPDEEFRKKITKGFETIIAIYIKNVTEGKMRLQDISALKNLSVEDVNRILKTKNSLLPSLLILLALKNITIEHNAIILKEITNYLAKNHKKLNKLIVFFKKNGLNSKLQDFIKIGIKSENKIIKNSIKLFETLIFADNSNLNILSYMDIYDTYPIEKENEETITARLPFLINKSLNDKNDFLLILNFFTKRYLYIFNNSIIKDYPTLIPKIAKIAYELVHNLYHIDLNNKNLKYIQKLFIIIGKLKKAAKEDSMNIEDSMNSYIFLKKLITLPKVIDKIIENQTIINNLDILDLFVKEYGSKEFGRIVESIWKVIEPETLITLLNRWLILGYITKNSFIESLNNDFFNILEKDIIKSPIYRSYFDRNSAESNYIFYLMALKDKAFKLIEKGQKPVIESLQPIILYMLINILPKTFLDPIFNKTIELFNKTYINFNDKYTLSSYLLLLNKFIEKQEKNPTLHYFIKVASKRLIESIKKSKKTNQDKTFLESLNKYEKYLFKTLAKYQLIELSSEDLKNITNSQLTLLENLEESENQAEPINSKSVNILANIISPYIEISLMGLEELIDLSEENIEKLINESKNLPLITLQKINNLSNAKNEQINIIIKKIFYKNLEELVKQLKIKSKINLDKSFFKKLSFVINNLSKEEIEKNDILPYIIKFSMSKDDKISKIASNLIKKIDSKVINLDDYLRFIEEDVTNNFNSNLEDYLLKIKNTEFLLIDIFKLAINKQSTIEYLNLAKKRLNNIQKINSNSESGKILTKTSDWLSETISEIELGTAYYSEFTINKLLLKIIKKAITSGELEKIKEQLFIADKEYLDNICKKTVREVDNEPITSKCLQQAIRLSNFKNRYSANYALQKIAKIAKNNDLNLNFETYIKYLALDVKEHFNNDLKKYLAKTGSLNISISDLFNGITSNKLAKRTLKPFYKHVHPDKAQGENINFKKELFDFITKELNQIIGWLTENQINFNEKININRLFIHIIQRIEPTKIKENADYKSDNINKAIKEYFLSKANINYSNNKIWGTAEDTVWEYYKKNNAIFYLSENIYELSSNYADKSLAIKYIEWIIDQAEFQESKMYIDSYKQIIKDFINISIKLLNSNINTKLEKEIVKLLNKFTKSKSFKTAILEKMDKYIDNFEPYLRLINKIENKEIKNELILKMAAKILSPQQRINFSYNLNLLKEAIDNIELTTKDISLIIEIPGFHYLLKTISKQIKKKQDIKLILKIKAKLDYIIKREEIYKAISQKRELWDEFVDEISLMKNINENQNILEDKASITKENISKIITESSIDIKTFKRNILLNLILSLKSETPYSSEKIVNLLFLITTIRETDHDNDMFFTHIIEILLTIVPNTKTYQLIKNNILGIENFIRIIKDESDNHNLKDCLNKYKKIKDLLTVIYNVFENSDNLKNLKPNDPRTIFKNETQAQIKEYESKSNKIDHIIEASKESQLINAILLLFQEKYFSEDLLNKLSLIIREIEEKEEKITPEETFKIFSKFNLEEAGIHFKHLLQIKAFIVNKIITNSLNKIVLSKIKNKLGFNLSKSLLLDFLKFIIYNPLISKNIFGKPFDKLTNYNKKIVSDKNSLIFYAIKLAYRSFNPSYSSLVGKYITNPPKKKNNEAISELLDIVIPKIIENKDDTQISTKYFNLFDQADKNKIIEKRDSIITIEKDDRIRSIKTKIEKGIKLDTMEVLSASLGLNLFDGLKYLINSISKQKLHIIPGLISQYYYSPDITATPKKKLTLILEYLEEIKPLIFNAAKDNDEDQISSYLSFIIKLKGNFNEENSKTIKSLLFNQMFKIIFDIIKEKPEIKSYQSAEERTEFVSSIVITYINILRQFENNDYIEKINKKRLGLNKYEQIIMNYIIILIICNDYNKVSEQFRQSVKNFNQFQNKKSKKEANAFYKQLNKITQKLLNYIEEIKETGNQNITYYNITLIRMALIRTNLLIRKKHADRIVNKLNDLKEYLKKDSDEDSNLTIEAINKIVKVIQLYSETKNFEEFKQYIIKRYSYIFLKMYEFKNLKSCGKNALIIYNYINNYDYVDKSSIEKQPNQKISNFIDDIKELFDLIFQISAKSNIPEEQIYKIQIGFLNTVGFIAYVLDLGKKSTNLTLKFITNLKSLEIPEINKKQVIEFLIKRITSNKEENEKASKIILEYNKELKPEGIEIEKQDGSYREFRLENRLGKIDFNIKSRENKTQLLDQLKGIISNPILVNPGLENIGNKCYLLSLIQCLAVIDPIINFAQIYKYCDNKYQSDQQDPTEVFLKLLDKSYIDSKSFKSIIYNQPFYYIPLPIIDEDRNIKGNNIQELLNIDLSEKDIDQIAENLIVTLNIFDEKGAIKYYPKIKSTISLNGSIYELKGIILHSGNTPSHGHYIATTKQSDNRWYLYNDDNVYKGTDSIEGTMRSIYQEIPQFTPYSFFYKKQK